MKKWLIGWKPAVPGHHISDRYVRLCMSLCWEHGPAPSQEPTMVSVPCVGSNVTHELPDLAAILKSRLKHTSKTHVFG